MIDALATEAHFLDHLAPIWKALPDKGRLHIPAHLISRAEQLGLDRTSVGIRPVTAGPPVLVASYGDMKKARRAARRVVMMEHGTGQSYGDVECGSYVGSFDREQVDLVLVPNQPAKIRHDKAHPRIPAVVIGSPYLDTLPAPPADGPACLSFHWDCQIVPETRTAWPEYAHRLDSLTRDLPGLLGHAHPRLWSHARGVMLTAGLTLVPEFRDVCARAGVYVVDNSSTLFLFAALDRPVVVLNSEHYRRDVHHGGRFWEWADVGIQVNDPGDLVEAVERAHTDPPDVAARRREVSAECFPHRGDATTRAVAAIQEVLHA